jgi:hypothetical protein
VTPFTLRTEQFLPRPDDEVFEFLRQSRKTCELQVLHGFTSEFSTSSLLRSQKHANPLLVALENVANPLDDGDLGMGAALPLY